MIVRAASFLIVAVAGCRSVEPAPSRPQLDWTSRYAVLLVDNLEAERLSKSGAEILERRSDGRTAVRMNAQAARAERMTSMQDPPFRYLDPGIEDRRQSSDPAVWWSGYKDEILTERLMRHLAAVYPEYVTLVDLGKSHRGRSILAMRLANGPGIEKRPAFLFNGAHHGNEPLAIEYPLDQARLFLSAVPNRHDSGRLPISASDSRRYLRYMRDYQIWIVPMVNPDGVHTFWHHSQLQGRRNARDVPPAGFGPEDGVDLNRNYPFYWNSGARKASSDRPGSVFYRGPEPASEPETRAMMRLARDKRFSIALSYHTFATRILVPYTADGAMSPVPVPGWRYAEQMTKAGTSHRPEKPYSPARNLYPVDGTDQDWLYFEFGTLAFIVEGSYQSPEYAREGKASIEGMRGIWDRVFTLYEEGPTIQLTVLEASGKPAHVRVRRLDQTLMEGERFETNPATGRYDFCLEEPGETDLQVTYFSGGSPRHLVRRVKCNGGICPVTIHLTAGAQPIPMTSYEKDAPGRTGSH